MTQKLTTGNVTLDTGAEEPAVINLFGAKRKTAKGIT